MPEGRAADRKRLFLSRAQLKGLLAFAADKRKYFPVTMADEIGYCGAWEPLVRDAPFFCGAGRAGCVVLPDGEVVPCTTLDRTASAGNIRDRSLREIWETGFAELRECRPNGKCATCGYASACQGGCWLQRRHGSHCYREVWHTTDVLKTAAGIAVCLGLTSVGDNALAQDTAPAAPSLMRGAEDVEAGAMEVLQRSIIRWYAGQLGGHRATPPEAVLAELQLALPADAGSQYFLAFSRGERAASFAARETAIRKAFGTSQRSLCLIGLAWRDVLEGCLDGPPPSERSTDERAALRRTVALIADTSETWRREILEDRLDPFLRRPLRYHHFFLSKAGPSPTESLEGQIAQEQWGGGEDVSKAVIDERPFAASLDLDGLIGDEGRLERIRSGADVDILAGPFRLRPFDIVRVPVGLPVRVAFTVEGRQLNAELSPASELTYADVLRLAHEQNRDAWAQMRTIGQRGLSSNAGLAIPEIRARLTRMAGGAGQTEPQAPETRALMWSLINLYLF